VHDLSRQVMHRDVLRKALHHVLDVEGEFRH
jgi:hypothetical protein